VAAKGSDLELCTRILDEVHSRITQNLHNLALRGETTLLDVGCWDGFRTLQYGAAVQASKCLGVEVFEKHALAAKANGIEVACLDLEQERFPWATGSVDWVVCNQVLEHLKNVWLPLSEIHRVLRPEGCAILSVPNLASLHNRVLLSLGFQPTSIRTFGPHIRGFTLREFVHVVTYGGAFEAIHKEGIGFPPLVRPWNLPLSRLLPGAAHTTLVVARKTQAPAQWVQWLQLQTREGIQTFFRQAT
jgi:SAM-dependent methyltransferase